MHPSNEAMLKERESKTLQRGQPKGGGRVSTFRMDPSGDLRKGGKQFVLQPSEGYRSRMHGISYMQKLENSIS